MWAHQSHGADPQYTSLLPFRRCKTIWLAFPLQDVLKFIADLI